MNWTGKYTPKEFFDKTWEINAYPTIEKLINAQNEYNSFIKSNPSSVIIRNFLDYTKARIYQIGDKTVPIPKYFYKVIVRPSKNQHIAFLMENRYYQKSERVLSRYLASIDKIEELSMLDLFP